MMQIWPKIKVWDNKKEHFKSSFNRKYLKSAKIMLKRKREGLILQGFCKIYEVFILVYRRMKIFMISVTVVTISFLLRNHNKSRSIPPGKKCSCYLLSRSTQK